MTANLMVPAGFGGGAIAERFKGQVADSLGEGIKGGFGIIGYKGKVWSTKFQGKETPLMRADGDGPKSSIEVVIVRSAPNIAKIFYENGYVDGSTAPPDCWSTNGVTPDGAASKKQSTTCAGCPMNAWGSKVTEAGKPTKACGDSKRTAIVPLEDLKNEAMGGPMLLRVPAASLKDIKMYGDQLQAYGYPYFAVATRISFDHNEAYPKFVFTAMRPLTDAEADIIMELRDGPQVNTILNQSVEIVHHEPEVAVPASPFENGAPVQAAQPVAAQPVAAQPVAAQPVAAQPVQAQPVAQVAQPAQAAAAPAAGDPPKRKRRTKEEMAAAAAALAAQRSGVPTGAAPVQPVQPAAQVAQPVAAQPVAAQPAQPVVQDPIVLANETGAGAPDDFEAQLDGLI